jgi:TolA-binding protein
MDTGLSQSAGRFSRMKGGCCKGALGLVVLSGLLAMATCCRAQQQPAAMTAHDTLEAGFMAFRTADYKKAESVLNDFLRDYGKSAEAKQYLSKVLELLSFSQIRLGKYDDALETIARYLQEYPEGDEAESLSFWQGISLLRVEKFDESKSALEAFLKKYPRSSKADDARYAIGLDLLKNGKYREGADYFVNLAPQLKPDMAYEALVLALYGYVEGDDRDRALELVLKIDPLSPQANKLAVYHLLALNLGSRLLQKGEDRKSLLALQRVWGKDKILSRQQQKLAELQARQQQQANDKNADLYQQSRLAEVIGEIQGEIKQLNKIPDYDTALQFRIAQAYIHLNRYRESYLVLRQMANKLPDSEMLMQAEYTMVYCLVYMERWDEVVKAAAEFEKRFPKSSQLALVLYLRGESCRQMEDYAGAYEVFSRIGKDFPDSQYAERCAFLAGYVLLMQDRNPEATAQFQDYIKKYPQGVLLEKAYYWLAMSYHYNKDYEQSRAAQKSYLDHYPKGQYVADSNFRRAQALFNQKNFVDAYKELENCLKQFPKYERLDELKTQLGDCYFALGEIDRGLAVYQSTSLKDPGLYDYAVFREGQAYKTREEYDKLLALFQKFLTDRPNSPRLTEALSQIAWYYRSKGDAGKAAEIYWQAVRDHGDDPEAAGVEDMLRTLAKYYRQPDEKQKFVIRLQSMAEQEAAKRPTLTARVHWMLAQLAQKENPASADQQLLAIKQNLDLRKLSPLLLVDVGDAALRLGRTDDAKECYRTLISWYPTSMLKDRGYVGMGLVARAAGNNDEALSYFALFDKNDFQSMEKPRVLRAKADIYLDQNKPELALEQLETLLAMPITKGRNAVEALYQIGSIRLSLGDAKKAIPYFQRIYVMYSRWSDYTAKAYWSSGQAFEKLNMTEEARKTYQEFIGQDNLKQTAEYARAQERLKAL